MLISPATLGGDRPGQGSGPVIGRVQLSAATVEQYAKLEITFAITQTVATNLQFPYDPHPPAGVPGGIGISVDALFSRDGWQTVVVQPAFLYQPYERRLQPAGAQSIELLYPSGEPVWKVRFAPSEPGTWRFRLRATDARGSTEYPSAGDLGFQVSPSASHGFLRVSQADPRYFEFSDGTPFVAAGYNDSIEGPELTYAVDAMMDTWQENRINLVRMWQSISSVVGASWAPWLVNDQGYDGYLPPTALTSQAAYSGPFSLELIPRRCIWQEWVPVRPGRTYRLQAIVKTVDVRGPSAADEPYGLAITGYPFEGSSANAPLSLTPELNGSHDWTLLSGTFKTGANDYYLSNLSLQLKNCTGGTAYIDQVSIREELPDGRLGPEMLRKGKANYHLYFDQQRSWDWDYTIEAAAAHGVYLKLVVMEKDDWIYNHLDANGRPTAQGSNDQFYAAPNTAVRRFQEYYWRYVLARWGYSTAIHSWELLNEGDPFNAHHYELAASFADYMHSQSAHRHLVTTSNWHSVPIAEFWGHPSYQSLDYVDIHASTRGNPYDFWGEGPEAPMAIDTQVDYQGDPLGASLRVPAGTPLAAGQRTIPIRGQGRWQITYRLRCRGVEGRCPDGSSRLAGPQLVWWLDQGSNGPRAEAVSAAAGGRESNDCSTPAGTYDWREMRTSFVLTDNVPHVLTIGFQSLYATRGVAWFDDLHLIAPDGQEVPINGAVTLRRTDRDEAWYALTWSERYGALSRAGAGKPLVRGEASFADEQAEELPDVAKDTGGVWFHNLLWAQVNPGGMYDLYWFSDNLWNHQLFAQAKAFRAFMDGLPINNGCYRDAEAVTSTPQLRVLGQADRTHGVIYLWLQNVDHTWRNVVDGVAPRPVEGWVRVPRVVPGTYRLEWWDTEKGQVVATGVARGGPDLQVPLPMGVASDIAVKMRLVGGSGVGLLPMLSKGGARRQ